MPEQETPQRRRQRVIPLTGSTARIRRDEIDPLHIFLKNYLRGGHEPRPQGENDRFKE